jgi:hypothetical protein
LRRRLSLTHFYRAHAAKDAVGKKADETSHNTKADAHKDYAKA